MSAKPSFYLDDCSDDDLLVALLRQAGHTVVTPRAAGTKGINDPDHLAYAAENGCAIVTFNSDDFRSLHREWKSAERDHGGILLVYLENDRSRDTNPHDVVGAIRKLLDSGLPLANELHVLNQWR